MKACESCACHPGDLPVIADQERDYWREESKRQAGLRYEAEYRAEQAEAEIRRLLKDHAERCRTRQGQGRVMSDFELPGMWTGSDFLGGDPDERSHSERVRESDSCMSRERSPAATPGPWQAFDAGAGWFIHADGSLIAETGSNTDAAEANAHLIAAAPDLLEAAKEALAVCESEDMTPQRWHDLEQQLRAAIAKAEGRTGP